MKLIKDKIEHLFKGGYIDEVDENNHNYVVYLATEDLKGDGELSEDYDVTKEEVEEIYKPFIEEYIRDIKDYDDSI
ncbi:MAG: hypothetical protein U9R08_01070 [Nanoarchaeota archaeon]|nr:hypothetical protein [Nanoarchaeota archaeon]